MFSLLTVAHSWAQQVDENELETILIKTPIHRDVIPVQKLQGKDLERLNALNVADAVRYFSGVKIKDYGGMGGLKTIDVRNMGSQHVGVMYNGIQLGNAQNGIVDLGKYSLDDVESITLYNGERSTILQSAKEFASASNLYIQSKRPRFLTKQNTQAIFRFKTSSIPLLNPSFRVEQRVSPSLNTSLSSEYLKSNGRYKFRQIKHNLDGSVAYDTTAYRTNSDIEAWRLEHGWYGDTRKGKWEAQLYFYNSERGLPGAFVKKSKETMETEQKMERVWDRNFHAQANWSHRATDRYEFQLKGKFANDYTHYIARNSVLFENEWVTQNIQADNRFYQQEYFLSVAHQFAIKPYWDIALATDLQYNKLEAERKGVQTPFSFPERLTFYSSLASSLRLGAFKIQGQMLATVTQEKVRNNQKAPNKELLSPSLLVNFKPFAQSDFSIHVLYKETYRLPTFNDLYYTNLGDAKLSPERGKQFNVGMQYGKTPDTTWLNKYGIKTTAYYAKVDDKIIATPTSSMFRWMMTNLGQVENYGLETSAQAEAQWGQFIIHTQMAYEYTVATDLSITTAGKTSSYGNQIPYTPWHSGSAILGIDYDQWSLNYSFLYVGKRYNGNKNNIKRNEVQPWYTHDIALSRSLNWNQHTIKASLEANNIGNQYYDVVSNFPMPGRNFRITLSMEL